MANDFTVKIKASVDVDNIKKQLQEVSKTTTIKFNVDGKKVTTEMSQLRDSLGNVYKATTKVDSSGKTLSNTFTALDKKTGTLGTTLEGMGRKIQSVNGVFQAMKNVVVNVSQLLEPLLEFEDALTELKKVSSLSSEELDTYTKKLGELGKEVGKSRAEMTDAATEFVKSGFSEDDAAVLARVAAQ